MSLCLPLLTGIKYCLYYVAKALLKINNDKLPQIIKSHEINGGNYNDGNNNMSNKEEMCV